MNRAARGWSVGLLIALVVNIAGAQPGQTPPSPEPSAEPVPPPTGYGPRLPVALTWEERQLLAEGEMPFIQHGGGGALAFMLGFGTGQAVQGRWLDTGWIFTFGDAATYAAMIYGIREFCVDSAGRCDNTRAGTLIVTGLIGALGLHIWEVLDAFIVPANRNQRVRALRVRLGYPPSVGLYLAPPRDGGGAIGGVALHF